MNTMLKKRMYFSILDCDAMKNYLEDMASQGWILKSIKRQVFYFEKDKPQKLYYSVDVFDKHNILYDYPNESMEYIDYCETVGWHHIGYFYNKLIIFSSPDDKTIPTISNEEKIKLITKSYFKQNLLIIIPFAIIVFVLFYLYLQTSLTLELEWTIILSILFLMVIFTFADYGFWYLIQKQNIKSGNSIQYLSSENYLMRQRMMRYSSILILINIFRPFFNIAHDLVFYWYLTPILLLILYISERKHLKDLYSWYYFLVNGTFLATFATYLLSNFLQLFR